MSARVLRPYQLAGVQKAMDFLATSKPGDRIMFSSPTGTGKGVIQDAIHQQVASSVLLAPSLEIARNWGRPDWVMTPVTFRNRIVSGDMNPPDLILVDECFPGDTRVATPDGYKKISTLAIGDLVSSYNHNTGRQEWQPVKRLFVNKAPKTMVYMCNQDGRTLFICTPNHPIYNAGLDCYVAAGACYAGSSGMLEDHVLVGMYPVESASECDLVYNIEVAENHNYFVTYDPCYQGVLVHNCHHDVASNTSYGDIMMTCSLRSRFIGFTATPYRGTVKSTQDLRTLWGAPVRLLTLRDAIRDGWIVMPEVVIEGLVDDDKIEVQNGELAVRGVTSATRNRLTELVALTLRYAPTGPTTICLASTELCHLVTDAIRALGLEANCILQDTSDTDRAVAYEACRDRNAVLVQIGIVSEGVDLPWLINLIDARPTLSPVRWLQTFGRLTRPFHGHAKTYVCTNRNVERHGYMLEGLCPPMAIAKTQAAFEAPSKRAGSRAFGIEAVGRFKSLPIPIANGTTGSLYFVYSTDRNSDNMIQYREYAVILKPESPDPIVATRVNKAGEDMVRTYGRWQRLDQLPDDLSGFATSKFTTKMSDKQKAWWNRDAKRFGLDTTREPNAREFCVLPVLADLREKLI